MSVEAITDRVAYHGEGAAWDERTGTVLWVDMLAGRVLVTDPADGSTAAIDVADPVAAAVRPCGGAGLLVARTRDVCLLRAGAPPRVVATLVEDTGIRLNEGGCDSAGRFVVGSLAEDGRPGAGRLWQVEAGRPPRVLIESVSMSNGVAFSRDGATMFYVDSATGRVDAYPYDGAAGRLGDRRTFAELGALGVAGMPDGVCIDDEDGIWVALWNGRAAIRIDASGHLDGVIEVPALHVTSCSFGGPDLRTLYITTSAYENDEASAGRLYACTPGVTGRPLHGFRDPSTVAA